ncbi:hypothetical protein HUU05_06400 [candidate division KSB1 bacterium]|nr:hypothetical protein [candidate division KSB1 bacterium]
MKATLVLLSCLLPWPWLSREQSHSGAPRFTQAGSAAQDTTVARKPSAFFIAIFSLGEAWQKDKPAHEQLYFKEHSANLKRLRQEKKLLLGGRYSDKGMIIISAENENAARAEFENDPMLANRLFDLELYPFSPFYKGCVEGQ